MTALKIAASDTGAGENHHVGGGSQGFRARLILFGKHPATRTQYYLEWLREHMDTWATGGHWANSLSAHHPFRH
mgnify:CR=1 FL=1